MTIKAINPAKSKKKKEAHGKQGRIQQVQNSRVRKSTPTKSMPRAEGNRPWTGSKPKPDTTKTTAARLNAIQTSTENGCITGDYQQLQSPCGFRYEVRNPIAVLKF
jgi:hypothetical protein